MKQGGTQRARLTCAATCRDPECDFRFNRREISRRHCVLTVKDESVNLGVLVFPQSCWDFLQQPVLAFLTCFTCRYL